MMREPCCAVGTGGPFVIPPSGLEPGCRHPWHISWLPKGFATTPEDYIIAVIAEPAGEDWSIYGFGRGERPPLIEAICAAIESTLSRTDTKEA